MHPAAVFLIKGSIARKAPFSFGSYEVETFLVLVFLEGVPKRLQLSLLNL